MGLCSEGSSFPLLKIMLKSFQDTSTTGTSLISVIFISTYKGIGVVVGTLSAL